MVEGNLIKLKMILVEYLLKYKNQKMILIKHQKEAQKAKKENLTGL